MNLKNLAVLTGTFAGVFLYSTPSAVGASSAIPVNTEQLTVVLKAANVLNSDSKLLNVFATGNRVTAMIQRTKISDDKASKIDAMFIARSLFDAFPEEIGDVRVLFSSAQGHEGRVVNISSTLVSDFTAGKIPAKTLISDLQVEQVQSEEAPDVMQGPAEDRRLLIWHRIKVLQDGGTGVKPFTSLFQDMESQVKAGNQSEILRAADNLEEKLSAQEEQVKLARKAAAGRGIIAYNRTNTNPSDKLVDGKDSSGNKTTKNGNGRESESTACGANAATNGAVKPTTIGGLPVTEFQNTGGVRFMELACQELEQRKDNEAQRYRDRKARIEDYYKYYDKSKAEAEYCDFKIDFLKKFGLTAPTPQKAAPSTLWGQASR